MSTLYRGSVLGDSLVEALDTLVEDGKLTPYLAVEVLSKYDDAMRRVLEREVNSKASLKGKLDVYRYIDNVWTFILSDATLRAAPTMTTPKKDEQTIDADGPIKLILVDAKLLKTVAGDEDENVEDVAGTQDYDTVGADGISGKDGDEDSNGDDHEEQQKKKQKVDEEEEEEEEQ